MIVCGLFHHGALIYIWSRSDDFFWRPGLSIASYNNLGSPDLTLSQTELLHTPSLELIVILFGVFTFLLLPSVSRLIICEGMF